MKSAVIKVSKTAKNGAAKSPSDAVINLRVPTAMRDLIDNAAAIAGKTRTEFVLDSARFNAEQILIDQQLFVLNDADFEAFQAMLDQPAAPNEALRKLMARKAPWAT